MKKRKNLTYAQKLEIVKLIDAGERKCSVGKKFGINESTVRGIYQKHEHIKSHNCSSSSDSDVAPVRTSRKRVKNEEEWKATVRKRKRVSE